MAEVEIPSYFLCPISLQLMRDPVTLTSGITFDRESIERWLFSDARGDSCPVTRLPLPTTDLTPNHTLRRLIQSWCVLNASNGVERIPTPRPQLDPSHLSTIIQQAKTSPSNYKQFLHDLQEIVSSSEANRRCVEASFDAVDFLVSIVESQAHEIHSEQALAILHALKLSHNRLLSIESSNQSLLDSLFAVLRLSNFKSRAYATLFLKSVIPLVSPVKLSHIIREENFHDIVNVVSDRISDQATKAALQLLMELFSWGRNRIKAVNVGVVHVLIELLTDETSKRISELALAALDKLCVCAEGRAMLVEHAAGIAVVSKKILRVSTVASERALRIIEKVSKMSATAAVLQEMLQVGVVNKLCLLLQVECGVKEKEKAREILILHKNIWMKSPCLSTQIIFSYQSSYLGIT